MKIRRSNYLRYGYNEPESEGKIQSKKVKKYDVQKLIQDSTEPYIWAEHIENDLMKFWKKDALELQGGLFPTYLTNEGFRLSDNPDEWTEEFKAALADDETKGLVTPSLPEPYHSEWKKDLKKITDILIYRFYSERYKFFWGRDTNSSAKQLGTDHTDFGHSVKTMWLIMRIGILLEDMTYVIFARKEIDRILKEAYIVKDKCWGRRFDKEGKMDKDKEWWILAELDQATAILSLNDPSYLQYLNHTYDYWFKYMVDHKNGEIWHMVDGDTNQPVLKYPKAHSWKTSLHSFEHALFGYMTSSQIKEQNFELYYAFARQKDIQTAAPYIFCANKVSSETYQKLSFMEDKNRIVKITYNTLR